jgi:hypothetical protein
MALFLLRQFSIDLGVRLEFCKARLMFIHHGDRAGPFHSNRYRRSRQRRPTIPVSPVSPIRPVGAVSARRASFPSSAGLEGCPLSQRPAFGTLRSSSGFFQDGAVALQPTTLDRPDFGSATWPGREIENEPRLSNRAVAKAAKFSLRGGIAASPGWQ